MPAGLEKRFVMKKLKQQLSQIPLLSTTKKFLTWGGGDGHRDIVQYCLYIST